MENNNLRKFYIGANHKMNDNSEMLKTWCETVNSSIIKRKDIEIFLAPSIPYLYYVNNSFENKFKVCSQNCYFEPNGAFDGETSAKMLKDLNIPLVFVGHSERRYKFGETNQDSIKKAKYAISQGLTIIFCLSEISDDQTLNTIFTQLNDFKCFSKEEWSNIIIAYEPFWATKYQINATPESIQECHLKIRNWISDNVSSEVASKTSIVYGGGINPINCQEIANLPDVDGVLVGVYSIDPNVFLNIIKNVKKEIVL